MAIEVFANVTTGSGTAVTWDIPAFTLSDYVVLAVICNSTSTTSTITMGDADFTATRNPGTGTGNTYPTFVARRHPVDLTITNTATLSVSSGWRAIAIVIRGSRRLVGTNSTVAAQNNHSAPAHAFTQGQIAVVLNTARLAASGTSTVTWNGAAWSETVDSYASNLQTAVSYAGPFNAGTNNWVSTWSTSAANTTRGHVLRLWGFEAWPLGVASHGCTALPLTRSKTKSLSTATHGCTALPLTRSKRLTLGIATSAHTALELPVEAEQNTITPLGTATAPATALPLSRNKNKTMPVAATTASALNLLRSKTSATGTATQPSTALNLLRTKGSSAGTAAETSVALAPIRSKGKAALTATEADTALEVSRGTVLVLGTAAEAAEASALTRVKSASTGLAQAMSSAITLGRTKFSTIDSAGVTSTALASGRAKSAAALTAAEADAAQTLISGDALLLGTAAYSCVSLPPIRTKTVVLPVAAEVDAATALIRGVTRSLGVAVAQDVAEALARSKSTASITAFYTNMALSMTSQASTQDSHALSVAVTVATSGAFGRSKSIPLGIATMEPPMPNLLSSETDVSVIAGDDIRIDITVRDFAGLVKDVTGATGTFLVYEAPDRLTLAETGTVSLVDASAGRIKAELPDTATDALGFSILWYAIKLTEADGVETTVQYGRLTVNA